MPHFISLSWSTYSGWRAQRIQRENCASSKTKRSRGNSKCGKLGAFLTHYVRSGTSARRYGTTIRAVSNSLAGAWWRARLGSIRSPFSR